MKIVLGAILTSAAMIVAFNLAGFGVYYAAIYWSSHILHNPDTDLATNLGLGMGLLCAVIVGVVTVRSYWRKSSTPLPH